VCREVGGLRTYEPAGELAMLVLEDAFEDKELLATVVCVGGEMAPRRVADDRCGASHLIADAIQHAPLNPGHRRGTQASRAA